MNGQTSRRSEVMRSASEGQRAWAGLWVTLLLAVLGFLVIYPILMLLLGALTDTNPVVDGLSLSHLSVTNFLTVLANPNVAEALANTLIACGGGTLIAVAIGKSVVDCTAGGKLSESWRADMARGHFFAMRCHLFAYASCSGVPVACAVSV